MIRCVTCFASCCFAGFLSWFRNGLLATGIGVIAFVQSEVGREAAYGTAWIALHCVPFVTSSRVDFYNVLVHTFLKVKRRKLDFLTAGKVHWLERRCCWKTFRSVVQYMEWSVWKLNNPVIFLFCFFCDAAFFILGGVCVSFGGASYVGSLFALRRMMLLSVPALLLQSAAVGSVALFWLCAVSLYIGRLEVEIIHEEEEGEDDDECQDCRERRESRRYGRHQDSEDSDGKGPNK